jgi:acyl-CoA synthetase (AMP-forming)/AMP-acid ligase II
MNFPSSVLGKIYQVNPVTGSKVTYDKVFGDADLVISLLAEHTCKPEDAGLVLLRNPEHYLPVLIACWQKGLIPAVYSPNLDLDEYNTIIKEFNFEFVITDVPNAASGIDCQSVIYFEELRSNGYANSSATLTFDKDKIALLLFSSGTTGKQKCIPLSFANILSNISSFSERLGLNENNSFLCGSPLWHAHGLYNSFLTAFFLKASVVYSGALGILMIKSLFNEIIKRDRIVFHITPSMIPILLMYAKKSNEQLPDFFRVICGTSFLDSTKKSEFEKCYNIKVLQQYGMTETLFMTINLEHSEDKPKSVGQVLENVVIEIEPDNSQAEPFKSGRIRVKSDSSFGSYYSKSNGNESYVDGYFYTGDIGYFDEQNYLFITGREKDIIKKGGFTIPASLISEQLGTFEGINEVFTLGMNDPELGEEVYSVYTSESELKEKDLKEHLKAKLSPNFIPRRIFRLESLPKTDSGKVIKEKVIELISGLI